MNDEEQRWQTLTNSGAGCARQRGTCGSRRRLPRRASRGSKLRGLRFRRQHAIGQFIVDFYCAQSRLIVEVDGPIHLRRAEEDAIREQWLGQKGHRMLRFSNDEVLSNLEDVLVRILEATLTSPPAVATSSPPGREEASDDAGS